ncbi:MAG: pentapeptide repeat-containing protein, partial [Bacteroidota bacterium]
SDDITRQVLDESLSKQELSFRQLWTKNLLSYVSQYMWEKCTKGHLTEAEVIEKVWTKIQQLKLPALQTGAGFRQEQMDIPFEDQFQTINLIQLLIQFETDRLAMTKVAKRSSLRAGIIFSHRTNFSDLDLSNIDLSEIKFVNCDFSGSILYCANLSNAVFEQCNFAGVNLRFASATNATFKNCSFSLPTNREDSAFLKFQIKGIALKRSYFKESSEELTPDILLQNGAIDLGSRYASKFGRDFLKNQKKYLGEGLKIAEDYYMDDAIMPTIKDMGRGKKNVILVDLMAGGNNDRIKRFFKQNTNLSILAVDKDTEQLKSVQIAVGYRFKVVKKTISGAIGLRDLIRQLFNTTFDKISARAGFKKLTEQADIIIGKKAIHEISRDQQKKLIEDCFQALSPGGRLILFTDSPPAISEEGFKRLQDLKKLVQSGQNADVIRHELVDSLKLGDSSDDVAIFSNLWVLLKDWANRNKGEVQRRYFSSINEIESWANEAGFKTMKEPFREHYDLTAKFFNEFAFNQIELLLERAPDSSLSTANKQLIAEYIKGTPRHKVFFDFAEHHLFTDKARKEHTPLGRALDAKQVPLSDKFREVNSRLENIDLPYQNGVSFRFSVHVVEFEKPK